MKVFLTEHKLFSHIDTPRIEAENWDEAESICNPNHKVIGILIEEGYIDTSNFDFRLN